MCTETTLMWKSRYLDLAHGGEDRSIRLERRKECASVLELNTFISGLQSVSISG